METIDRRVASAFAAVREHAEAIRNDEHQTIATMSPRDAWAQGDLLLVCLSEKPAVRLDRVESPALQLAPGDTQGSRHCLESLDGITVWRRGDPGDGEDPLDGPILEAPRGLRVNHPEHGDVSLPPGIYSVVYQRAYAEELRRIED